MNAHEVHRVSSRRVLGTFCFVLSVTLVLLLTTNAQAQYEKRLIASDAAIEDQFGTTEGAAISGDTALVGVQGKDNDTGAAYIFQQGHGGPENWAKSSS